MTGIIQKFKHLNPPVKWLFVFIAIVLGVSIIFAPRPRPVNLEEIGFSTSSSSRLFFKNTRSYYYDIYTQEKPPFVLYRLKRRIRDSSKAPLQFMIIENSMADEAYIFVENRLSQPPTAKLAIMLGATDKFPAERFAIEGINNEQHQLLAAKVYRRLLQNEQMHLVNGNDTLRELFEMKKDRSNAEIVLEDYFKLVNKL